MSHISSYVKIGSKSSIIKNVPKRVPEGSVLVPMFFILYINDMPEAIKDDNCPDPSHQLEICLFGKNCPQCGSLPSYSDDSTYLVTLRTRAQSQSRIIEVMDRLKNYLNDNSLSINLAKTEIVEIMVKQKWICLAGSPPNLVVQESLKFTKFWDPNDCSKYILRSKQM